MSTSLIGIHDNVNRPVCVTPWSFIHFMWGVAFTQSLGLSKSTGLLIHTVYEIINNHNVKKGSEKLNVRTINTTINSLFDTLFFMIGQNLTMTVPSSFFVAFISWGLFEIISGDQIG